ncbi:major facilitator superfamily domain-containing protein 8-like [Physella acuta]|uniref:major facilitator superfamily domain-containing protein 8-like n=1 Tax=Physella acuta TaxID=109671 RepID=UPI0027DD4825|nr:major facilitator superfamily domain-containing protein 8-like [Physella acuta]
MSTQTNNVAEAEDTTPLLGSRVRTSSTIKSPVNVPSTAIEPPNVYRSRWRSIRVMYLTMFLGSVTFTITMSSLWPFLQVLNPSVTESFLGWVVAAYSVGQFVASPVFGGWANLRSSSREPLSISLFMTALSNFFYMYLQSMPSHKDYFMILARGLIGFSAGNVAVVRSYVSGATSENERTGSMANLSIFQAMGFILGPVIQAALVPVGYPGPIEVVGFHLNMYTAPALFAALVAVINLILLVTVFREHRVYDTHFKAHVQGEPSEEINDLHSDGSIVCNPKINYKPDYIAVVSTIFLFFVVLFIFTVFETIGTPLTMHMYAWSKSKATLYQGITLGVAGFLSIIVFLVAKTLTKRYNERYLLLFGFIVCLCGFFVYIPWGNTLPPQGMAPFGPHNSTHLISQERLTSVFNYLLHEITHGNDFLNNIEKGMALMKSYDILNMTGSNLTTISKVVTPIPMINTTEMVHNTTYTPEGCPWNYAWCSYVPVIHLAQYFGATILISIGYPMCNMLSYTIYSKVLGPIPQGLWMGWLTAAGSLARTVGPIYVSQIYDSFGPQITFGSCCAFIVVTIGYYLVIFRRLVPFSLKEASMKQFVASA